MTASQLSFILRARPFRPFLLRHAEGRETRVSNPEAMRYLEGPITTYTHPDGRVEIVDMRLISSVRFLRGTTP